MIPLKSAVVVVAKMVLPENVLASPSSVDDAAVIVMFALPLKDAPFIVRAVVSVAALPVVFWFKVGTSAATIARQVGAPLPLVGPAKKKF
jgi:hypothetical protein